MHYVLGMALNVNGRNQEALEQFLVSVKIDQRFIPAYIGACGVLMAEGRTDSVLIMSEKALERPSPYAPHVHNLRGRVYMNRGDLGRAAEEFRSAIASNRQFISARVNLARVYAQQGKRQDAIDQLEEALSVNPNDAEVRRLLEGLKR
jgi:tetratricopeptide (TPR) repeat protein